MRYERISRILIGSVLSSNFSTKEIQGIAKKLITDPYLAQRIGNDLLDILHLLKYSDSHLANKLNVDNEYNISYYVEDIIQIFSNKRISKNKALKLLSGLSKNNKWKPNPNDTLRNNVYDALNVFNSEKKMLEFYEYLINSLSVRKDPYLRELL